MLNVGSIYFTGWFAMMVVCVSALEHCSYAVTMHFLAHRVKSYCDLLYAAADPGVIETGMKNVGRAFIYV